MISYKENHKDFRFTLRTISVLCKKINDSDYFPSHLLADYSGPITKGLRKYFRLLPKRRLFAGLNFF
jgi:hypothetical protein